MQYSNNKSLTKCILQKHTFKIVYLLHQKVLLKCYNLKENVCHKTF